MPEYYQHKYNGDLLTVHVGEKARLYTCDDTGRLIVEPWIQISAWITKGIEVFGYDPVPAEVFQSILESAQNPT